MVEDFERGLVVFGGSTDKTSDTRIVGVNWRESDRVELASASTALSVRDEPYSP